MAAGGIHLLDVPEIDYSENPIFTRELEQLQTVAPDS